MATILEEELETYLFNWKQPEDEHEEHPIDVYGKCYRQLEIKGYGVLDLLFIDISPGDKYPQVTIHIVELKKGNIDLSALGQICRYKTGLERFINNLKDERGYQYFTNFEIRGTLVGEKYAEGDICYAVDNTDWLSCYHYSLDLSVGITFECHHGWHNASEDFKKLNKLITSHKDEYIEMYKHDLKEDAYMKKVMKSRGQHV